MERRAYKDKKGNILAVLECDLIDEAETHHPGYRTAVVDSSGALLKWKDIKALPHHTQQYHAQEDLDAYALQHELEAAEMPSDTPQATPETATTEADGGEGVTQEEGEVSAPPPQPPDLTLDEKDEKKRQEHEHTMDLYHNELRLTAAGLIRTKEEKKAADQDFNETIKGYDARMADLLYKMREEEQRFVGYMAPPPPGALPFDAPVNPEVNKDASPTLDGEPPTVPCEHCVGSPGFCMGQPCPHCMGTGQTIPQPEPEAEAVPPIEIPIAIPHGKCECGHDAAAHFDEEGRERGCIITDGHGSICSCPADGGYADLEYDGPWVSKFSKPAPTPEEASHAS